MPQKTLCSLGKRTIYGHVSKVYKFHIKDGYGSMRLSCNKNFHENRYSSHYFNWHADLHDYKPRERHKLLSK